MKLDMLDPASNFTAHATSKAARASNCRGRPRAVGPECSHRYKQLRGDCCQTDVDLTIRDWLIAAGDDRTESTNQSR